MATSCAPSASTATFGKCTLPLFRRHEETENERLLREAGLSDYQGGRKEEQRDEPPQPFDPYAGTYPAQSWTGVYTRAMARPEEWDVYTTADAPQLAGDAVEFATLPNGDVIVDDEQGDADLSPLADAIERHLHPPYRAHGRREQDALWAVAARGIDVRTLTFADGDTLDLVVREGRRELKVDGVASGLAVPELAEEGDYVVHAERLDGDLWEIQSETL